MLQFRIVGGIGADDHAPSVQAGHVGRHRDVEYVEHVDPFGHRFADHRLARIRVEIIEFDQLELDVDDEAVLQLVVVQPLLRVAEDERRFEIHGCEKTVIANFE